jgi:hypothetical protein
VFVQERHDTQLIQDSLPLATIFEGRNQNTRQKRLFAGALAGIRLKSNPGIELHTVLAQLAVFWKPQIGKRSKTGNGIELVTDYSADFARLTMFNNKNYRD